ncbi:MAG TPA: CpaD family pilus assembly lipoprotein [Sphingomicrobium sp.]|nr:CpaD family pilus assembly lipoprotein [Sphingomicrobium sp.]
MRSTFACLALGAALAGCATGMADQPSRGVAAVNVPVVTRADFVFDAAAPEGFLPPHEAARLDAWFRNLGLGYGDSVHVAGGYNENARADVQRIAGQYGMLVQPGVPVTAGAVAPGVVRVVVARTRASVPGCPNWGEPASPNYENRTMPNFGCAVNGNLAAMVANPQDLVFGREGSGVSDASTASRAIGVYRTTPPTGTKGLQDISTKKDQ